MINCLKFDDEVFKDIEIENILPIYQISNYGTVINKETGSLMNFHIHKGYGRVSLRTTDGNTKQFLIHRLVMMTFHPINNPNQFEVNHMYGKKLDNRDFNLEWVTTEENIDHAIRTGLLDNNGEKCGKAVISNDQAELICQLLSEGKSVSDIKDILGDTNSNDIGRIIRSIRERKSWNSISNKYSFENVNERNMFTDDEAIIICQMLENGYGYKDILISLGFDVSAMSRSDLENMCNIISNIRIGKYYSHISKNFDMISEEKKRYDQKFSRDQIHHICKSLELGMTYVDILSSLGITKFNTSQKEYDAYRHAVSTIKCRKAFTDISINYNF